MAQAAAQSSQSNIVTFPLAMRALMLLFGCISRSRAVVFLPETVGNTIPAPLLGFGNELVFQVEAALLAEGHNADVVIYVEHK